MVENANEPLLGIEGYSAERGLYETTLKAFGLHKHYLDGSWGFADPDQSDQGQTLASMWAAAQSLFDRSLDQLVPLSEIAAQWQAPPFGLKEGLTPIYLTAFLLAKADSLALYHKGYYQPAFDRLTIDKMLLKPVDYAVRKYELGAFETTVLQKIAAGLERESGSAVEVSPHGIVRRLVKLVFALPSWTKGTKGLSDEAEKCRDVLLNAKDPFKALFTDMPAIMGIQVTSQSGAKKFSAEVMKSIEEMQAAFPSMLVSLRAQMVFELGFGNAPFSSVQEKLIQSAQLIKDQTGHPRLQTFASRLIELTESPLSFRAIAGLLISKPPRDWTDEETKLAETAMAELCLLYRREEVLHEARVGDPKRSFVTFIYGAGKNASIIQAPADRELPDEKFDQLAKELEGYLSKKGVSESTKLALVARVGAKLAETMGGEKGKGE